MLSPSKVRRKKNNQMLQKKLEYFFKKEIKPKKPYQTCSPELAGWEKKESKKLPKKKR